MRALLAFGILLLGLGMAAPEPELTALVGVFHRANGGTSPSLVEIESSTKRGDRLSIVELRPRALPVEILKPRPIASPLIFASAGTDIGPEAAARALLDDQTEPDDSNQELSLGDLCNAVLTSAQDNELPIPFFANLLWQESRLRNDAVSKKGALGIAQFMPQTAVENGLDDPFDPRQAIPASARFLRELWLQFGNLGFVAAAYNAGPHRVAEWLEHRSSLPRETLNYVVRVTGLSAEAWRKIPVDDAALTFVRPLPCRSLPAFASFEQERSELAQAERVKIAEAQAQLAAVARKGAAHGADNKHARHETRRTASEHHAAKRTAEHPVHAAHEKRKSA
jgi:hypothetical protein